MRSHGASTVGVNVRILVRGLTAAGQRLKCAGAGLQNARCCRMMRGMSDLMRLKQTSGMSMISIIEIIKTILPAGPEGRD